MNVGVMQILFIRLRREKNYLAKVNKLFGVNFAKYLIMNV